MVVHDQRDAVNWVVIELTRLGEIKAQEAQLDSLLRDALKADSRHPVFIPSMTYTNGGHRVIVALMEGYAFVASGLPEMDYFSLEGRCPFVRKVLSSRAPNGMRVLSVIPDHRIQEMKKQLSQQISEDITEGMRVRVVDGVYTHLEGVVLQIFGESARVRFTLRSLDLIAPIPRVFLEPLRGE